MEILKSLKTEVLAKQTILFNPLNSPRQGEINALQLPKFPLKRREPPRSTTIGS